MKQAFKYLIVSSLAVISISTQASIISDQDVSNIETDLPELWTAVNSDALFDGMTGQRSDSRFIGYRNNGAELSSNNPFIINIELNDVFTVTDFSFFNDWGKILEQQVVDLNVSFFDNGQNIQTFSFEDLALDTFDEISLFQNESIADVSDIQVSVTKLQKTNFEIREFVFTAIRQSSLDVSTPSTIGLFLLLGAGLILRSRKNH